LLISGTVPILVSLWYGFAHQALIQAVGLAGLVLVVVLFVWIIRLLQKLPQHGLPVVSVLCEQDEPAGCCEQTCMDRKPFTCRP
jgi:hypothetical protein